MDLATFIRKFVIPLGLLGVLTAMADHEYSQSGEISANRTHIEEQEKRVDRLESKIDNLLEKLDKQNDKIDDLRIDVLKRKK